MANEKTYMARTQMKSDSAVNWQKATNFSPLKGEMIIYSGDPPRLKVGDGTTNVNDLPFTSAAIYVGDTAPTGNYDLWIDTSADTGDDTVQVVIFTQEEKTKLAGIEAGANKYVLPTAGAELGGVKTTSLVSDATGLTAAPIIDGVPYYKETEIAPDWNENDSASKNYIDNRPGAFTRAETITLTASATEDAPTRLFFILPDNRIDLIPGETYQIVWGGQTYNWEAKVVYANTSTGAYTYSPTTDHKYNLPYSVMCGYDIVNGNDDLPIVLGSMGGGVNVLEGAVVNFLLLLSKTNLSAGTSYSITITGKFDYKLQSLVSPAATWATGVFDAASARISIGYAQRLISEIDRFVSKSGDTMTGPLTIEGGYDLNIKGSYYPSFNLVPTNSTSKIKKAVFEGSYSGSVSISAWEDDSGQNRRIFEVRAKSYESSLDSALRLRVCDNDKWSDYKVFHSGTTVPITSGGTGATTAAGALTALGAFPISGGTLTGAAMAGADAQKTLSTAQLRNITISTTDLVEGESTLAEGEIYLVYDGGEA